MDADEHEFQQPPIGVRVVPLQRRTTSAPLRIEGRIAASRAVQIKAPTSGIVSELSVQLGSRVEAYVGGG